MDVVDMSDRSESAVDEEKYNVPEGKKPANVPSVTDCGDRDYATLRKFIAQFPKNQQAEEDAKLKQHYGENVPFGSEVVFRLSSQSTGSKVWNIGERDRLSHQAQFDEADDSETARSDYAKIITGKDNVDNIKESLESENVMSEASADVYIGYEMAMQNVAEVVRAVIAEDLEDSSMIHHVTSASSSVPDGTSATNSPEDSQSDPFDVLGQVTKESQASQKETGLIHESEEENKLEGGVEERKFQKTVLACLRNSVSSRLSSAQKEEEFLGEKNLQRTYDSKMVVAEDFGATGLEDEIHPLELSVENADSYTKSGVPGEQKLDPENQQANLEEPPVKIAGGRLVIKSVAGLRTEEPGQVSQNLKEFFPIHIGGGKIVMKPVEDANSDIARGETQDLHEPPIETVEEASGEPAGKSIIRILGGKVVRSRAPEDIKSNGVAKESLKNCDLPPITVSRGKIVVEDSADRISNRVGSNHFSGEQSLKINDGEINVEKATESSRQDRGIFPVVDFPIQISGGKIIIETNTEKGRLDEEVRKGELKERKKSHDQSDDSRNEVETKATHQHHKKETRKWLRREKTGSDLGGKEKQLRRRRQDRVSDSEVENSSKAKESSGEGLGFSQVRRHTQSTAEFFHRRMGIALNLLLTKPWNYVAWLLCLCTSAVCIWGLIVLSYSMEKGDLWLSTVLLALFFKYTFLQPGFCLLQAIYFSYVYDVTVELKRHRASIFRPHDLDVCMDYRHSNQAYYRAQLKGNVKECRIGNEILALKRTRKARVILLCMCLLLATSLVYSQHSPFTYYNTLTLRRFLILGRNHHSAALPLAHVNDHQSLMEYLEDTIVGCLLEPPSSSDSVSSHRYKYRANAAPTSDPTPSLKLATRRPVEKPKPARPVSGKPKPKPTATTARPKPATTKAPLTSSPSAPTSACTDMNSEPVKDRAFTVDRNFKLLGDIRIRQLRVKSDSCEECERLGEWKWFSSNMDTDDYGARWEPLLSGERFFNVPYSQDMLPWLYSDANNGTGSAMDGSTGRMYPVDLYPGSGYIVYLGKSSYNAHIALKFINEYNWIDQRSRVVFVELTLYNVNTDVYSMVTIMVEVSASGVYIPSYEIESRRVRAWTWVGLLAALGLACCLIASTIFLTYYAKITRERVGMRISTDMVWMLACWTILISTAVASSKAKRLLGEMDAAANMDYISFHSLLLPERICDFTGASAVAILTAIVGWKVLGSGSRTRHWLHTPYQVVIASLSSISAQFIFFTYFTLMLAICFYLLTGSVSEGWGAIWGGWGMAQALTTKTVRLSETDYKLTEWQLTLVALSAVMAAPAFAGLISAHVFSCLPVTTRHINSHAQDLLRSSLNPQREIKPGRAADIRTLVARQLIAEQTLDDMATIARQAIAQIGAQSTLP